MRLRKFLILDLVIFSHFVAVVQNMKFLGIADWGYEFVSRRVAESQRVRA